MAPITISITRTIVRELPMSHSLHLASVSADRSGATTATTIGAAIVVIEAQSKDHEGDAGIETCDVRLEDLGYGDHTGSGSVTQLGRNLTHLCHSGRKPPA
jgi:hypothetical protein